MRNKTYALLISGLFSVMLIPSSFALEVGGYSDSGKWRPVQGDNSQRRENPQPGTDPWAGSNYYNGFSANDAGSRFRFRPLNREQRPVAPMRWTYRPAQIDIPNHYVYRPLKVNRTRHATDQHRQKSPAGTGLYDYYGVKPRAPVSYGYSPSWVPFPGFAAPSYDAYRFVERNNRYSAVRPMGRYYGYPMAERYPYPPDYPVPRYTGNTPAGPRFRPLNRSRWDGRPNRGQPGRYVANPYSVPDYQRRLPGWDYRYAMQPGWYPQPTAPYPGMQQPMGQPHVPNRYGVNWYDGRSDGDGAWYQMAGRQEWPRVSQYLPLE